MKMPCWAYPQNQTVTPLIGALAEHLALNGFAVSGRDDRGARGVGIYIASEVSQDLHELLHSARLDGAAHIIVIMAPSPAASDFSQWRLLESGASDVLVWTSPDRVAQQVRARFERWLDVEALLDLEGVTEMVVGKSPRWRAALRQLVEIARFGETATLILGESGTGKELAAKLIHQMDARPGKRDLVIQDCSTLAPELSGSELFGHERGAFTGALSERHGAFELANGGTLFLDEIGELHLPIQAQLLRAIQERTYKRVGGSKWHRTDFRLICATNRDLLAMVERGAFREDLYYRVAGHVCKLPPLRDRLEDVLPLARSFIRQCHSGRCTPTFDPLVCDYLVRRDYPGNVRELKQVVSRLAHRCAADGAISIGCVPCEERPSASVNLNGLASDPAFETSIRRAVMMGAGLKEIGRAAEDCAIHCATHAEDGSLRRAARRLGVTDRALQLRRAQGRLPT